MKIPSPYENIKISLMKKEGALFLSFNHLRAWSFLRHGFSTRLGGVSPHPFESLNLGFTTEDSPSNLKENQKRFFSALELKQNHSPQIIRLIHSNKVITTEELPSNPLPLPGSGDFAHCLPPVARHSPHSINPVALPCSPPDVDGIVTDRIGFPLITTFADCVPVFLADPVRRAVGILHAGWRGTLEKIAEQGVKKMMEAYNCKPENILAGVGPGIGICHFEVDPPVWEQFSDRFPCWEDLIRKISNSNTDKRGVDLLGINQRILVSAGLKPENIIKAELCTYCNPQLFYSYRRDGKNSGRMAGVIALGE